MREELSLKAAILAEKFAPDLSWYVYIRAFMHVSSNDSDGPRDMDMLFSFIFL